MNDSGKPGTRPLAGDTLSEQQVVQHLKHCRDLTRGYAYRVFPAFWRQWCKLIEDYAERARSNKDQTALYEIQRLLVASQQEVEDEFCQRLGSGYIKFKNKMLNTLTGEERFSGDMLSLVEHSDLEETIAITSITHRADGFYGEQLWALHQRLALLNGGDKPDERSNPASPVQFCEALRKSLAPLKLDNKTKILGYKTFDQEVIGQLDGLYDEINDYLIDQQILPNLKPVPVNQDGAPSGGADNEEDWGSESASAPATQGEMPRRRATDRLLGGEVTPADNQYQYGLLNAIRLLQSHIAQRGVVAPVAGTTPGVAGASAEAAATGGTSAGAKVYTSDQLIGVLQSLQVQALGVTRQGPAGAEAPLGVAQSIQQVSQQMVTELATEGDGAIDAQDLQVIDLVGMLFEYMLSDDNLPDSVKALLSYLHTPFLKIAFIDKDFFEQADHPARVLLNSLAEAGARWVSNDGTSQNNMHAKIKAVVFRLLEEFKNDVRIFAELLLEFNTYTTNLVRRQELMERRALEKVQGEEKLREAKQRVNGEVRNRTDGRELPSAVLLLLLQPWSDYLSFVLLRYGERSDSWQRALRVVDELLWSVEPKTLQADKERQRDIHEGLMKTLLSGFETIGYDPAKGRKLLEAVTSLQKMALLSRKAEPAPAPMRTKLETMAAEKAGHEQAGTGPVTPEERQIVDNLKMIEFGTWFEFEGGKRLKVAWYNKRTLHYMLVDQQGRKVAMSSGLELAREMIAGRAKVIAGSTKPFFERALENIYHHLNAQAQGAQEASA